MKWWLCVCVPCNLEEAFDAPPTGCVVVFTQKGVEPTGVFHGNTRFLTSLPWTGKETGSERSKWNFAFYLHVLSAIFTSEASIQAKLWVLKRVVWTVLLLTRSTSVSGRGLQWRSRRGPPEISGRVGVPLCSWSIFLDLCRVQWRLGLGEGLTDADTTSRHLGAVSSPADALEGPLLC